MTCWQPFIERIPADADPKHPRYENGIDFVLTPAEKSKAALYSCHLRSHRDRLSKEEEKKESGNGSR